MKRLLGVLFFACVLGASATSDAANVVRAYTCLIGGTTGCVDKTPIAEITNGDIAFVVASNVVYFYQFNSSATDAESSPAYIRPDDYATAGVWVLVNVRASAIDSGRSAEPCLNFYDLNTTDADVNASICANATTTTSDAENVDLYLKTQTGGGAAKIKMYFDGAGLGVTSAIKVLSKSTTCTIGSDCDGTSVQIAYGGVILATAAITITLPEIVAITTSAPSATQVGIGASICVIARDAAEALVIDSHANDSITLAGVKDTAGQYITATGAGAFACLLAVEADNWMVMGTSGTWSAE